MPASASIAAARSLASRCVIVERLERPRLAERVLAAEQELRLAANGIAHVLELEAIRVLRLELDALDGAVAAQLDHGVDAVPGVVEEERSLAADRLQLVPLRQRGAAVERRDDVVREAQQPGERPVGARGDRKSTRLNSSHPSISYAVFC